MIDVAPLLYETPLSKVEEEPPELPAILPDNDTCLVEDINNKKRQWVMKYELYPINNVYYSGWWAQNKYYDDICKYRDCADEFKKTGIFHIANYLSNEEINDMLNEVLLLI